MSICRSMSRGFENRFSLCSNEIILLMLNLKWLESHVLADKRALSMLMESTSNEIANDEFLLSEGSPVPDLDVFSCSYRELV